VPGFLLDSHLPLAVVPASHAARPSCPIHHLAKWMNGAFLHDPDELILSAARDASPWFVTYDVGTIPDSLHRAIERGEPVSSVVLIPRRSIGPTDVGGIVRALVQLYDGDPTLDPTYPVVYLRPTPHR
jgi:hypothetical protein